MKVNPKNDEMRKLLKHPQGGIAFPGEGAADWPDDSFTARRVADGDITLVEENKAEEAKVEENKVEEAKLESEAPIVDVNEERAPRRGERNR
jgi:hypothetical protein